MNIWNRLFNNNKDSVIEKREDTVGTTTYVYDPTAASASFLDFFANRAEQETNSVVFRSIRLICDTISHLELNLFERDDKGYGTEIHKYEGLNLIKNKPNKIQTTSSLISVLVYDVIMKGDGVIEIFRDKMGNPVELRNAFTFSVQEKTDDFDLIYTISDSYGTRVRSSQDVIHVKANTKNGKTGRSLFLYAAKSLNISMNIDKYLDSYFNNGFFSSGYLSTEQSLNKKQFEEIKESWQGFSGPDNVGKTPILHSGLQYKSIMIRPSEVGVADIKTQMISDIARFFGVPLGKLNLLDTTVIDPQENKKFYDETLSPYIHSIEQEISNKLFIRPSQEKLFIKFNINQFSYIEKDVATTYATFIHNAIYTPNEVRKILNLPPLSNGDFLYLNYIKLDNNDSQFNKDNTNDKKE